MDGLNFELILHEYGYNFQSSDSYILELFKDRVKESILNKTNQKELPNGLKNVYINRVIGEFLDFKYNLNQLNLENVTFDRMVKSITEGDTSVTYMDEESDTAKLRGFIDTLKNYGADQLVMYRRIIW